MDVFVDFENVVDIGDAKLENGNDDESKRAILRIKPTGG